MKTTFSAIIGLQIVALAAAGAFVATRMAAQAPMGSVLRRVPGVTRPAPAAPVETEEAMAVAPPAQTPPSKRTVRVTFLTPDGQPLVTAIDKLATDDEGGLMPRVVATLAPLPPEGAPMFGGAMENGNIGRYRALSGKNAESSGVAIACDGVLELDGNVETHVAAVLRHIVLDQRILVMDADEVRFVIEPGDLDSRLAGLTLNVVDATGRPVDGASVTVTDQTSGGSRGKTRKDGSVVFRRLRPGVLLLRIRAAGLEHREQHLVLGAGQRNDPGPIVLSGATTIRGRVVDADGLAAAAHVAAHAVDRWEFPQPFGPGAHAVTDSEGNFTIADAGRGPRVLIVRNAKGALRAVSIDVAAGGCDLGTLRLEVARAVTIAMPLAFGPNNVLQLRDAAGGLLASECFAAGARPVFRLAKGRYAAALVAFGGEPVRREFEVDGKGIFVDFGEGARPLR